MLKTIVLVSCLLLLQSCISQPEEMQECLFKKEMLTGFDGVDETTQAKQPAPLEIIPYWVFSKFNHSLVIPTDNYNKAVIFPSDDLERATTIILEGSNYTIKFGGGIMDFVNHEDKSGGVIDRLKLGIKSKLSDTVCITKTAKSDINTLRAIGYKAMLISGAPSYINKLDSSNESWLFTSEKGQDRYEWRTLLTSSDNIVFEYAINHINTKDYRPISGLLSQNNLDIIAHASKNPPQWIPFLIDAFDANFETLDSSLTPKMKSHGLNKVDTGKLSFLAFEAK